MVLAERVTKSFFEQNERAAQLRNICLLAIDAANTVTVTGTTGTANSSLLLAIDRQLAVYGVEADMHVVENNDPQAEKKRQSLRSKPVLMADWLAGQVRIALQSGAALEQGMTPAEFVAGGELQGESTGLRAADFATDYSHIVALRDFIDYAGGPSELGELSTEA